MASNARLSYQRLRNEEGIDDLGLNIGQRKSNYGRVRSWSRRYRKVHIRRKLKIRIPRLKKFLRRKAKLAVDSWCKVLKRLKDSQAHFGDLFAGNYLFMQVTPTSLKYLDKSSKPNNLNNLHDISSRYYVPKVF